MAPLPASGRGDWRFPSGRGLTGVFSAGSGVWVKGVEGGGEYGGINRVRTPGGAELGAVSTGGSYCGC